MEWIKVEDRLPEIGAWILFFSWRGVKIGSYWGGLYKIDTGIAVDTKEVTHWMPLPNYPKP